MVSIVERALAPWAERMRTQVNLPVRLRWGPGGASTLALGDFETPRVEIRVRDAQALPLLIEPGLDTLGQAYVEGLVDVDGTMADILAVAHRLAETAQPANGLLGRVRRPACGRRRAGGGHGSRGCLRHGLTGSCPHLGGLLQV